MTKTHIDKSIYLNMPNKDLIKKQEEIEILLAKIKVMKVSNDTKEDVETIYNFITDEIDRRLENGSLDEDELEED